MKCCVSHFVFEYVPHYVVCVSMKKPVHGLLFFFLLSISLHLILTFFFFFFFFLKILKNLALS